MVIALSSGCSRRYLRFPEELIEGRGRVKEPLKIHNQERREQLNSMAPSKGVV